MATTINLAGQGEFATFGVTTDIIGAHKFQWKRNGLYVGGNNKTYTTPPLTPDDFKVKYSVLVTGQDKSEESPEVTIGQFAKPTPKPVAAPAPATPAPATPAAAPAPATPTTLAPGVK